MHPSKEDGRKPERPKTGELFGPQISDFGRLVCLAYDSTAPLELSRSTVEKLSTALGARLAVAEYFEILASDIGTLRSSTTQAATKALDMLCDSAELSDSGQHLDILRHANELGKCLSGNTPGADFLGDFGWENDSRGTKFNLETRLALSWAFRGVAALLKHSEHHLIGESLLAEISKASRQRPQLIDMLVHEFSQKAIAELQTKAPDISLEGFSRAAFFEEWLAPHSLSQLLLDKDHTLAKDWVATLEKCHPWPCSPKDFEEAASEAIPGRGHSGWLNSAEGITLSRELQREVEQLNPLSINTVRRALERLRLERSAQGILVRTQLDSRAAGERYRSGRQRLVWEDERGGVATIQNRQNFGTLYRHPTESSQPRLRTRYADLEVRLLPRILSELRDAFSNESFQYDAARARSDRPSILERFARQVSGEDRAITRSSSMLNPGTTFQMTLQGWRGVLQLEDKKDLETFREAFRATIDRGTYNIASNFSIALGQSTIAIRNPDICVRIGEASHPYALVVRTRGAMRGVFLAPLCSLPDSKIMTESQLAELHPLRIACAANKISLPFFDLSHPFNSSYGFLPPVALDTELRPCIGFERFDELDMLEVPLATLRLFSGFRLLQAALAFYKTTAMVHNPKGEAYPPRALMVDELLAWHGRALSESKEFIPPLLQGFRFNDRGARWSASEYTQNFCWDTGSLRLVQTGLRFTLGEYQTRMGLLHDRGKDVAVESVSSVWEEEILPKLVHEQRDGGTDIDTNSIGAIWTGFEPRLVQAERRYTGNETY